MIKKFSNLLFCLFFLFLLAGCSAKSSSSFTGLPVTQATETKFTGTAFEVTFDINNRTMTIKPAQQTKTTSGRIVNDNLLTYKSTAVSYNSVNRIIEGTVTITNNSQSTLIEPRAVIVGFKDSNEGNITVNNYDGNTGWTPDTRKNIADGRFYFNLTSNTPNQLPPTTGYPKLWQFRINDPSKLTNGQFSFVVYVCESPQIESITPDPPEKGKLLTVYGYRLDSKISAGYPKLRLEKKNGMEINTLTITAFDTSSTLQKCEVILPNNSQPTSKLYYIALTEIPPVSWFTGGDIQEVSNFFNCK